MELQVSDTICRLVGDDVDAIALRALESLQLNPSTRSGLYAITLATRLELKTIDRTKLPKSYDDVGRIHPFGVGGDVENGPFYVVVIWAAGQLVRKKLGLLPRHFYIMLSDSDNSDDEVAAEKGIDTLLPGQFPASLSKDLLDHLTFTLLAFDQYDRAMPFCVELIFASHESYRGFLRYADIALKVKSYKLSMLSYAAAFQRADEHSIKEYCIKKMIQCSLHTEWGSVFKEGEILGLPQPILPLLGSPWTEELRCRLSSATLAPILCLESRERLFSLKNIEDSVNLESNFQKLPRFFRWLIPFHFAIMSTPREESDIATLASPHLGIRHILTLTEETPIPKQWLSGNNIKHTYLPIPNYHPPTIEQMDFIIRLFQEEHNLPLLVHCGGGKGRAGTVAACYLSAYGFGKPQADLTQPTIPAGDAVAALRVIRPGSIETPQQEAFVSQWASAIWKRRCIILPLPEEPLSCSPDIEGELGPENDLFVLVGLPGSGKSWFSQALIARNPKGWTHISQDESGSRSFSESEIGRASGRVLLDRCNSSADDRRIWLKLASWAVKPVCIYFEYDPNLCISRAQNRANHPTLPPGNRVRNAVDQMQKSFVKPSLGEGFKAIVTIRSFAASREIVMLLSPAISVFKYPRTPHLLNLGAATDDDLISQSSAPPTDGHIVITEKVCFTFRPSLCCFYLWLIRRAGGRGKYGYFIVIKASNNGAKSCSLRQYINARAIQKAGALD